MFILTINTDIYEDVIPIFEDILRKTGYNFNIVKSYCTDYDSLMYIHISDYSKLDESDKLIEYKVNNSHTCILETDLKEDCINILYLNSSYSQDLCLYGHTVFTISNLNDDENTNYKVDTDTDDLDLKQTIQYITYDLINHIHFKEYGLKQTQRRVKTK